MRAIRHHGEVMLSGAAWVSCVNSRHRPLQLTSRMLSRAVSSVLAIKANPKHRLSNLSILLLFFWPVF